MSVTLSLGYDTERPYGAWARRGDAHHIRDAQLAMVERLNACLDALEAPRTFFLLGDYLEQCAAHLPRSRLRSIFDIGNPLIDLQQHSHSHASLRPIPGRPDEPLASAAAFGQDVRRASAAVEVILGACPTGLRIPRGYDEDLHSLPEVVAELAAAGLDFVSSDLRSPSQDGRESFAGALCAERQPHTYAALGLPGLVEIPSHGYQDVFFTRAVSQRATGAPPWPPRAIAQHYTGLLSTEARELARGEAPVHVALCLHPFALLEYDGDLAIHRELVESARRLEIEIVSYRALADRLLAPPR